MNDTPKNPKTGRPSDFSQEMATAICERLVGGESLRTICKDAGMPDPSTVYRWLAKEENAAFREQYARAREWQMEAMGEDILEIADDGARDTKIATRGDGSETEVCDHEWVARSKLRVDARKFLMSKLAPKKYGDAMTLKGDAVQPLNFNIHLDG